MSHRKLAVLQPTPPDEIGGSVVQSLGKADYAVEVPHQPARKRAGVNVNGACEPCRRGKRRCDGVKPTCNACLKRSINSNRCVYDQLEGLSRAATLKHNAQTLRAERDNLRIFVKDLLSVAPGTTVEEGIKLTEAHGLMLPHKLRAEINDIVRQKQPRSTNDMNFGDDSLITPVSSVMNIHTGPSSPDLDISCQRSISRSSSSPTTTAISMSQKFERSCMPKGRFSDFDAFDQEEDDADGDVLMQSGLHCAKQSDYLDQQALNALYKRMARQSSQGYSPVTYKLMENTPLQCNSHLQIYAHLPVVNANTSKDWTSALSVPEPQTLDFQVPMYMVQPLLLRDHSPLSRTVVGFLELARARVKQGWSSLDILGPVDFDVSRLVSSDDGYNLHDNGYNPPDDGYNPHDDVFSVPDWAISVVLTFSEASTMLKLSLVLQLARMMRWLIAPTPENYALIPEGQKPTPLQRMVPHKAEFDFLMLPAIRDALILRPREYMQVYFDSAQCNWADETPMVEIDTLTNSWKITTEFEQHINNDANWSFGSNLLQTFPELIGKCNHHGAG